MIILGLDISTKIGWSSLDTDLDVWKTGIIKGKGDHGMPRIAQVWTKLEKVLCVEDPHLIVIEAYAFNARGNTLTKLVETGTVVRWNLWNKETVYPYIEVAPTMLKKFTTDKGNANKEEMMVQAFKRWGVEGTNDEVDAFGLAKFGAALMDEAQGLTQFQKDTVKRYIKTHGKPEL